MKKTQTIVDRERLSSDYIESKQDFSNVLSQVKLLSTTSWKSPWFYGPIGIAVLSVTISIVSLNPSAAIASLDERNEKKSKVEPSVVSAITTKNKPIELKEEVVEKDAITEKESIIEKSINSKSTPAEIKILTHSQEVPNEVVDTPTEVLTADKKIPADNRFPYIDGYFTGEIPVESLFDEKGILLNENVKVVSFDLNLFTGRSYAVNQVRGNSIPSEMRSMITNFNIGKTIFITNIKAYDRDGKYYTLPSINYIPI